jgi:hypothetical protein
VKQFLLPSPRKEVKSHIDDENISGSTKSELKDVVPQLSKDLSSNDNRLTVRKKLKKRKLSNFSDHHLKLYKHPKRFSCLVIHKPKDTSIVHSKSEVGKLVNMEGEFEFPMHQNLSIDIENDNKICLPLSENDIRTYEIEDEILGKITIRTKVIESTEKLKMHDFMYKKSFYNEKHENKSANDLHTFLWDNIEEYNIKEAKKAVKEATQLNVNIV